MGIVYVVLVAVAFCGIYLALLVGGAFLHR